MHNLLRKNIEAFRHNLAVQLVRMKRNFLAIKQKMSLHILLRKCLVLNPLLRLAYEFLAYLNGRMRSTCTRLACSQVTIYGPSFYLVLRLFDVNICSQCQYSLTLNLI